MSNSGLGDPQACEVFCKGGKEAVVQTGWFSLCLRLPHCVANLTKQIGSLSCNLNSYYIFCCSFKISFHFRRESVNYDMGYSVVFTNYILTDSGQ